MKKTIVAIILTLIMLFSFCGCNYRATDTHWNFNTAYIKWSNGEEKVSVKSWTEDGTTFTIVTEDGRVICTSQVNIILVEE